MNAVKAVADYIAKWVAWVEQNKAGLSAAGAAIGAVYNGVENGADGLTLALAVGALIGTLTHFTSTPLSNPKTSQGVPLVPSSVTIPVNVESMVSATVTPEGAEQVVTRLIDEAVVDGKRLGRHVEHDVRSLLFQIPAGPSPSKAVRWVRRCPVLNQGDLGACTGNAMAGWIGTDNAARKGDPHVTEKTAVALYEKATTLDTIKGSYPPDDTGSSGLAVAKAAREDGYIGAYHHATSLPALLTALQSGPVIVGTEWLTGLDKPDSNGLVHATGTVRGGHEYEVVGYDPATGLLEFVNSWGRSYGKRGHGFISTGDMARLLAAQGDCTVPVSA